MTKHDLLPAFVQALGDVEAEVRTAAAGKIPGFARLINEETILRSIMPRVRELVIDSSQHVRASLSQQISGLAPTLGKPKYGAPHPAPRCLWPPAGTDRPPPLAARLSPRTSSQHDPAPAADLFGAAQGRLPGGAPEHHLQDGPSQQRYG